MREWAKDRSSRLTREVAGNLNVQGLRHLKERIYGYEITVRRQRMGDWTLLEMQGEQQPKQRIVHTLQVPCPLACISRHSGNIVNRWG